MCRAGFYLCDIKVYLPHPWRDLFEYMSAKSLNIFQSLVKGIFTFISCCMAADSMGSGIYHQQSSLRCRRLHSGRLTDNGEIDLLSQLSPQSGHSILSGPFLFTA